MYENRIPVSKKQFANPNFEKEKTEKAKEVYVFEPAIPGCGTAATFGNKLPKVIYLAGHFVKKIND